MTKMWKVQLSSQKQDGRRCQYRNYTRADMLEAYNAVKSGNKSVRQAAKDFNVPKSSLRDRVSGQISIDQWKSGKAPIFTTEQEYHLANHFKFASANGYQYGRTEMINIASEFAVYLGLRERENTLSNKWYTSFLQRWPDLQLNKPRMSTGRRTFTGFSKPAVECIKKQEKELGQIMAKYKFKEKPERIYLIDDRVMFVPVARMPHVVSKQDEDQPDHRIMSVIGCGNVIGNHIPPYFIFSGDKMKTVCLKDRTPGSSGNISQYGKVDEDIFFTYVKEHFNKFIPERSADNPVLLLCDESKLYISPDLIKWTEKENIMVLLIASDDDNEISCFGTFDKIFQAECAKFTKGKSPRIITENTVCRLASKSYINALSAENLHGIFRHTGIYPYKPAMKSLKIKPFDFIIDDTGDSNDASDGDVTQGVSMMNTSIQLTECETSVENELNNSLQEIGTEHDENTFTVSSLTEHNYGMGMRVDALPDKTVTLSGATVNMEELSQNIEAALSSSEKEQKTVGVDKNYNFFSNIEKVLLDNLENFKDTKSVKGKLSFVFYKEDLINHLDDLDDGGPSPSKKNKEQEIHDVN